jgi:hypothetical protein
MPSSISSSSMIQNRRRGLRILLWVFSLFWLAQIMGGLVLDYVWLGPRYPRMREMFARLKARRHAPDILFLGSSRFESDVHEAVLDAELRRQLGEHSPRTFNASFPAGDPTVFERVFHDMLGCGYRPRLVILEVNPATLAGRDNWLYQHAMNVLDWRDVPDALPALCRNGRIMYLVNGRLLPLYVHRYHIRKEAVALAGRLFRPAQNDAAADPPVPPAVEEDPEPPMQTPAILAAMEHGYVDISKEVRDYRLGGVVTRRLERLLDACRSAGITVVLVGVPVSSPSRRACTSDVNTLFLDYMRRLESNYGCTFADWRALIPDAYFADTHHVTHEGGIYFSRRFATAVLAPLWRKVERKDALAQR